MFFVILKKNKLDGNFKEFGSLFRLLKSTFYLSYTICPDDNATAGSLGRRRAGQLRFGFVAVSAGHIVY
jgi:hypothetical protein